MDFWELNEQRLSGEMTTGGLVVWCFVMYVLGAIAMGLLWVFGR